MAQLFRDSITITSKLSRFYYHVPILYSLSKMLLRNRNFLSTCHFTAKWPHQVKLNETIFRSNTSNNFNSTSRLRSRSKKEVTCRRRVYVLSSVPHRRTTYNIHQNKRTHWNRLPNYTHTDVKANKLSCISLCAWMRGRVWRNFTFRFGNVARPPRSSTFERGVVTG